MWSSPLFFALLAASQTYTARDTTNGTLPVDKVYGVNLGSWLLTEPWMLPNEWVRMGGETCFQTGSCADCAASEFDLVKKLGQQRADEVFQQHWETWFSEGDVHDIVNAGLNTVRIPIGYWIIESLVDRNTEFYPRGGLKQLKRGVQQLKSAGINILLDFHAMPGVSSANQMFAGHCTADVEFYTPPNYFRALQWAAAMTFVAHADPAFSAVFGIEAANEPLMDPAQTPGYADYLADFVRVVRAVERALGVTCPGGDDAARAAPEPGRVRAVLESVGPMLASVAAELALARAAPDPRARCLRTTFMDALWQGARGPNPTDAAAGPAVFDDHLYFNFGGVAAPNPDAYLAVICNLPRVTNATALGNVPLVFGEWALSTNFNATDAFLTQWADAQKRAYAQAAGWIFWSFKIEAGNVYHRQWDYFSALEAGHFTRDPSALNDPHVCDAYVA